MTDVVKLITYHTWANQRIAQQVAQLPNNLFTKTFGGSFPSIQLTLRHQLESDWAWLHRWKGIPFLPPPTDWKLEDAYSLSTTWAHVQLQMEELIKTLAPHPAPEVFFTTKKGVSFRLPLQDTVIHVINHGTYHRGQAANMIRAAGEQPVSTDYFIFCTQQN